MSIKRDLDDLIDWYEDNNPSAGQTIPVRARPSTLSKFAKKKRGGPYTYRARIIVPVRPAKEVPAQEVIT